MLIKKTKSKYNNRSKSKNSVAIKPIDIIFALIVLFFVGFILGTYLAPRPIASQKILTQSEQSIEMVLPAVDVLGNGVAGKIITTIRPGSGQVLVDVNNVLAKFDTQLSGRIAVKAASKYLNMDTKNVDIIYSIKANADVIEGSSAGASMAVSVAALFQNKTIRNDVSITGTIDEDGNIGPVGSVLEKSQAVKQYGITTFLVPIGQASHQFSIKEERECNMLELIEYCIIKYKKIPVNIGENINMTIIEVKNLEEALKNFSYDK